MINNPRTFSVLGAPGRVEQIPFSRSRISLVEAVAQSGGANPNAGDAAGSSYSASFPTRTVRKFRHHVGSGLVVACVAGGVFPEPV